MCLRLREIPQQTGKRILLTVGDINIDVGAVTSLADQVTDSPRILLPFPDY